MLEKYVIMFHIDSMDTGTWKVWGEATRIDQAWEKFKECRTAKASIGARIIIVTVLENLPPWH